MCGRYQITTAAEGKRLTVDHALHLFLLFLVARLFGELSERIGQPASMGEITAGVAVGLLAGLSLPIPLLAGMVNSPFLDVAAEFGIFFLLLLAGIELRPSEIADHSAASFAVAVGGVIVPLGAGFALGWIVLPETPLKFPQALLVGVALSISAVPVAVRIFMELGLMHTRIGRTVVSAALFDDVLGLMLLAVLIGAVETGTMPNVGSMLALLGQVGAFFLVTVGAGLVVYPRFGRTIERLRVPMPHFSALVALALAYSVLAEALGMNFVLGAFMAGLFFDPASVGQEAYDRVKDGIGVFTNGLLAPLFFASIGVRVELGALTAVPGFVAMLLVVAFVGKLVGAGLPARLSGLSSRASMAVGIGMSGRGAIELIVASVALQAGLLDQPDPIVSHLFSALVIMAVTTTLATPILLRWVLGATADPSRTESPDG